MTLSESDHSRRHIAAAAAAAGMLSGSAIVLSRCLLRACALILPVLTDTNVTDIASLYALVGVGCICLMLQSTDVI